jgi:Ca-activated chloride channel family protein
VPQKGTSGSFTEYDGQQVWSKLDFKLLQEIAMKTSGVYIPAGTRSYDLGQLYADHLQGRRGKDAEGQKRTRRGERYQVFLAIAFLALLTDWCLSPYVGKQEPGAGVRA